MQRNTGRLSLLRALAPTGVLITVVSALAVVGVPDGLRGARDVGDVRNTRAPDAVEIAQTGPGPIGFGAGTTGGAGGETVTVSTAGQLVEAMGSNEPTVVRVDGTIQLSGMERVGSDTTVVGVGAGGRIEGGGLNISRAENVIVRNLTIDGSGDDNINVEYSTRVWIDHNNLSGAADGALDIKRGSDNITVSWNHFHDQDKNALLGHSDNNAAEDRGRLRVTYHHNWFDGTNQRNPRVRFGNPVHVFNNYYNDIGSYGIASTQEAGVLVEANYFENVDDPFHLGEAASPPGSITAVDNHMVNSGPGQTGGGGATNCSRLLRLWFPLLCQGGVNPVPYAYTPDRAEDVRGIVTSGAGVGQIG